MRRLAIALVLLLAVAGAASAGLPKSARFELDRVPYAYVAGVNGTATMVVNGGAPMPVDACAFVMLHEGTPNGRTIVRGLQEGGIPLSMFIDQFRRADGERGYDYDRAVTEDGLQRTADLAINGNGTLRVGLNRYYDPVTSTGDPLLDKDQPDLTGQAMLLPAGVRDDATGEVLATSGKGDEELHLHLRSVPGVTGQSIVYNYASPDPQAPPPVPPLPPGTVPVLPSEAYGAVYWLPNLKLGGTGTITIDAKSYGMDGQTSLTLRVLSPLGLEVASTTVTPSLLADDSGEATFPLDLFGDYALMLSGSVSLTSYTITATLAPPESLDVHLWFENVTYGNQAFKDLEACELRLQSPDKTVAVANVVSRPPPPRVNLFVMATGLTGLVVAVLVGVKLASDQISLAAFRKAK